LNPTLAAVVFVILLTAGIIVQAGLFVSQRVVVVRQTMNITQRKPQRRAGRRIWQEPTGRDQLLI
jgi:uncharacterized membrane protein YciS (DUF1049 family)